MEIAASGSSGVIKVDLEMKISLTGSFEEPPRGSAPAAISRMTRSSQAPKTLYGNLRPERMSYSEAASSQHSRWRPTQLQTSDLPSVPVSLVQAWSTVDRSRCVSVQHIVTR